MLSGQHTHSNFHLKSVIVGGFQTTKNINSVSVINFVKGGNMEVVRVLTLMYSWHIYLLSSAG